MHIHLSNALQLHEKKIFLKIKVTNATNRKYGMTELPLRKFLLKRLVRGVKVKPKPVKVLGCSRSVNNYVT